MAFTNHWGASALMLATALGVYSAASADVLYARLGGLAYYDPTTNLTWLANADAGYGSTYDSADGMTDGLMTWANANAWAASLKIGGVTGWRLPTTNPISGSSYNYNFAYNGSTDLGFNISAPGANYAGRTGSEMAYMFYNTLGNMGEYDTSGQFTACGSPLPAHCLTNTGPFSNVQSSGYWSATEYGPSLVDAPYYHSAWAFNFSSGQQTHYRETTGGFYAWAMHTGDVGVSTVPVPAALLLFGSGLLGLIGTGAKRRR